MSNNKKKRKFQIEPNSLSPVEESAVKSVMNLFRNRGADKHSEFADSIDEKDAAEKIQHSSNIEQPDQEYLDTQSLNTKAPNENLPGRPNKSSLDTRLDSFEHSSDRNLVALTPKIEFNAPKLKGNSDSSALNENLSGHSEKNNWRKYEKNRSTVRVNLHINREIDKQVRQYCLIDADPKIELKEFYERAAINLLGVLDTQKQTNPGAETPLDDRRMMLTSKSKAFLINLYLTYNSIFNPKSKWTIRDDEAGARFNDIDYRIIELGIIQTHFNRAFRPGKINSFQYYVNQIEEMLTIEFSEETLQAMITINRTRWQKSSGKQIDLSFLEKNT